MLGEKYSHSWRMNNLNLIPGPSGGYAFLISLYLNSIYCTYEILSKNSRGVTGVVDRVHEWDTEA